MSFLFSLIIIVMTDYIAISIFWIRHKKEIINRQPVDFSEDVSVLNFRKKKNNKKKVKVDPEEEGDDNEDNV